MRAFGRAAEIQNHNLTIFLGRYNQVGGVCSERSCRRLARSQQTCRIDKLRRAIGPGCKEPGGRLCRKVYDKMPGQSVTKPMNKRFGPLLYFQGCGVPGLNPIMKSQCAGLVHCVPRKVQGHRSTISLALREHGSEGRIIGLRSKVRRLTGRTGRPGTAGRRIPEAGTKDLGRIAAAVMPHGRSIEKAAGPRIGETTPRCVERHRHTARIADRDGPRAGVRHEAAQDDRSILNRQDQSLGRLQSVGQR